MDFMYTDFKVLRYSNSKVEVVSGCPASYDWDSVIIPVARPKNQYCPKTPLWTCDWHD